MIDNENLSLGATYALATMALSKAEQAHSKMEFHEDLCAERYSHIHTSIAGVTKTVDTVLKTLAWGGSTFFIMIIALLAFFATRAVDTNDSEVQALRAQVEVLRAQSASAPKASKVFTPPANSLGSNGIQTG